MTMICVIRAREDDFV